MDAKELKEVRFNDSEPTVVGLDKYVDILYSNLAEILNSDVLTPLNITMALLSTMQIIERFPKLKGKEKKEIVLHAIRKYVNHHPSSNSVDLNLIPSMIDTMVSLDKGEITIKINTESCLKCFGCS